MTAASPESPRGTTRLGATLRRLKSEGRAGLSVYLPFGDPDGPGSQAALSAAVAGGADWLELGIPFSDPAADGPILQAASARALANGATVAGALDAARRLRAAHPDLPLVAMTYANVVFRRGWDGFCQDAAAAGLDGVIVPDVPLEESGPLRAACARHGLAYVPLVTPTTPDARMRAIAATCTGFLYVVANVGVTGQADVGALVGDTVARARKAAPGLPIAVGFGVRSPDDVRRIRATGADAIIVGSHVVAAREAGGPAAVQAEVARLRAAC